MLPISVGNKTQGGTVAKALHFTKHKPYVRNPAVPQHWYLTCTPMPTMAGESAEEDEERKAYHGRRYGDHFGGVLGSTDEVLPGAPLHHSRPPVERAVAPNQETLAPVIGMVHVQVTIPADALDDNATVLEDEAQLRHRVL